MKNMAKKRTLTSHPNSTIISFEIRTPEVSPKKVSPYQTLNKCCSSLELKCELKRICGNTIAALQIPAENISNNEEIGRVVRIVRGFSDGDEEEKAE